MRIHELFITVSAIALCAVGCQKLDPYYVRLGDLLDKVPSEQPAENIPPDEPAVMSAPELQVDAPDASKIPVDAPVVTPAPEPQVDAPVASETPQSGPKLPAKAYPGNIAVNGLEWTLTGDPGGWTDAAAMSWDGKHWGGCAGAVVVGRNQVEGKVKIRWNEYATPNGCVVFVLTENSTGRPRNVYARWIKEIL